MTWFLLAGLLSACGVLLIVASFLLFREPSGAAGDSATEAPTEQAEPPSEGAAFIDEPLDTDFGGLLLEAEASVIAEEEAEQKDEALPLGENEEDSERVPDFPWAQEGGAEEEETPTAEDEYAAATGEDDPTGGDDPTAEDDDPTAEVVPPEQVEILHEASLLVPAVRTSPSAHLRELSRPGALAVVRSLRLHPVLGLGALAVAGSVLIALTATTGRRPWTLRTH